MTKASRLDGLKKKQEQLKAQIQTIEAAENSKERKCETRRKILVGAYCIDKAKTDGSYAELISFMDGYLRRASDRKLFDLEPVKEEQAKHLLEKDI